MDKSNIIISIIIVLCIAAAVTAYGITNSDNPLFSNLSSMGASDNAGNGIGNNTTLSNGSSVATTSGSSASSGSSDSGSSSGSSSSGSSYSSDSSSSSSGSSSSGSSSSSSDSGSSGTQLSYSTAKAIASDSILEDGCYAGGGYYSDGYWIFNIYDEDGNVVGSIGVNDATGSTEEV
jgi:hypothetical protein